MSTPSESRAERGILVWDAPVRVFHWLMVACFAGAWLTSDGERWRLVHVTLGYTMLGLVAFRILWGLLGTRYARFSQFVRGPGAAARYLASLARGRPEHHTGHNPAGAIAIVLLLGLTLAVGASGWATYNDLGGEWLEEVHEAVATFMLVTVIAHVAAVAIGSWLHKENLVRAMVTGRKAGAAGEGVRAAWRSLAAVMLVSVIGFWWLQWQSAPQGQEAAATARAERDHDDD